jgi:hypothetical protein
MNELLRKLGMMIFCLVFIFLPNNNLSYSSEGIIEDDIISSSDFSSTLFWPMKVGQVYEYTSRDSRGNSWNPKMEILNTKLFNSKSYFYVRLSDYYPGEVFSVYARSTEDAVYLLLGNDEFLAAQKGPAGTTWTDGDTVTTIMGMEWATVPFGGPFHAYKYENHEGESASWYEYWVPGLGIVKEVDYDTVNPPKIQELTNITYPSTDTYALGGYLQYRTFENPSSNTYRGWIAVTKNGNPVNEEEVISLQALDSKDNELTPIPGRSGYSEETLYTYDCTASICKDPLLVKDSGFYGSFFEIKQDTYKFEVIVYGGQKITKNIFYPGKLELPVVPSSTIDAKILSSGDMEVSWSNPTSATNWNEVHELRMLARSKDGRNALHVQINSAKQTVVIPKSLMSDAESLYGDFGSIQIQTRAFDNNQMNYARGVSDWKDVRRTGSSPGVLMLLLDGE